MGALVSIGLFVLKHWKLIAGGLVALALVSYIGWLKIDNAWIRSDLRSATGKIILAQSLQHEAEEQAATQHEQNERLIDISNHNAALTVFQAQQTDKWRERAVAAEASKQILDRSYSALIGKLNDAQSNAPLSDQQRAFVRELWCLEQARYGEALQCSGGGVPVPVDPD